MANGFVNHWVFRRNWQKLGPLRRDFSSTSSDADLKGFCLEYFRPESFLGEYFYFNLTAIPWETEVELIISLTFWYGYDRTPKQFYWKVTSLGKNDRVNLTCPISDLGAFSKWEKIEVEIAHVKRSPASGKPPTSVLIKPKTIPVINPLEVGPSAAPILRSVATSPTKTVRQSSVDTAMLFDSLLINTQVDPIITSTTSPLPSAHVSVTVSNSATSTATTPSGNEQLGKSTLAAIQPNIIRPQKGINFKRIVVTKNFPHPLRLYPGNVPSAPLVAESNAKRSAANCITIPTALMPIVPLSTTNATEQIITPHQIECLNEMSVSPVNSTAITETPSTYSCAAKTPFFPNGYCVSTNDVQMNQTGQVNKETIVVDLCNDDVKLKPMFCSVGVQSGPECRQEPNLNGSDISVAKNQRIPSADAHVVIRSPLSTTNSDQIPPETSQPPAKKQKIALPSPVVVNHSDAESVAPGVTNQIIGGAEEPNVPPIYPGWMPELPYVNLVSADGFVFPVIRDVLVLNSAVLKADLTTESARRNGLINSAFSGDVLLELLNFLYGKNFTAKLPTVALELYRAAEHYRLQVDTLKKLVEEELIKQLSLENFSTTVGVAKQIRSDRLVKKILDFARNEKDNEKVWEDLQYLFST